MVRLATYTSLASHFRSSSPLDTGAKINLHSSGSLQLHTQVKPIFVSEKLVVCTCVCTCILSHVHAYIHKSCMGICAFSWVRKFTALLDFQRLVTYVELRVAAFPCFFPI
jgi:hypothetical protein